MTGVRVRNVAEVNAALRSFDVSTRAGIIRELQPLGQTVASGAQSRALGSIRKMHLSPEWAAMRVGATGSLVYVAPVKRGRKFGRQKRRNLAPLMLNRAMIPALLAAQPQIVSRSQEVIARTTGKFNRGAG